MAPSRVDKAKMMPASENDAISAGSFYFACLNLKQKAASDSYWIVLRLPREWLPHGFFDTRPMRDGAFAFWILGKKQRVWLPRTSLFYLHRSQQGIFTDHAQRHEFREQLNLINELSGTPEGALSHFQQEVLDSTSRHNERRERMDKVLKTNRRLRSLSCSIDDHDDTEGHDFTHDASLPQRPQGNTRSSSRHENQTHQARRRQTRTNSSKQSSTPAEHQTTATIKTEEEKRYLSLAEAIMGLARVRIYVGRMNKEYIADIALLEQSAPGLHSMIATDDTGDLYIMHPRLRNIDPTDFLLVLEFIQSGEYHPKLIANPDGRGSGSMALDGLEDVEDYSVALVQAGRLYVIAEAFQVKGMINLITHKAMLAQYKKYNNASLIEFARIMFNRPLAMVRGTSEPGQDDATLQTLDRWIIGELAENFMEIMRCSADQGRYLDMIEATAERHLHAFVLERAAINFRTVGGLPELIEDSD